MVKGYLWKLRHAAEAEYARQVRVFLEKDPRASYLDCGCSEGARSRELAGVIGTSRISGVEIDEEAVARAQVAGLVVTRADLNLSLPLPDEAFDVVTALEVIEHLHRPDCFLKELRRLLRPGGYAVLATENLASWHNVFALCCGWQPFSLAQFSEVRAALGNPWGLDRGEAWNPALTRPSFRHCLVLSYRGLKELFQGHGFLVEGMGGAGYYPLPPGVARGASALDPRHSAFLTFKIRKSRRDE